MPFRLAALKMLLVFALLVHSPLVAAARDLIAEPLEKGSFAVGSANFTIDDDTLRAVLAEGGDAGDYQSGKNDDGKLLYINALLAYPDEALNFELDVPDDATLYGDSAGTKVPISGYLMYPTTQDNPRPDHTVFLDPKLPRMQDTGQKPIFSDETTKYPLVVYSHGAGGHPTVYSQTFMETLASHGYIVFGLYHGDDRWGTQEQRRFNLRPLAVKAAIDWLLAHADFGSRIDQARIGGAGESFGGATMPALLGAGTVNPDFSSIFSNRVTQTTVDTRIKAAGTIVPYMGAGSYAFFGRNGEGGLTIDRPFLANSSNADEVADYDKVQAVMQNVPGTKFLVEYEGEIHALSDGARSDIETWIKIFLDAYVKGDDTETFARLASVSASGQEQLVLEAEAKNTATQYLQTNSASANITTLHVINTSSAAQSYTGTLYNGDGERLGSENTALHDDPIAANGRLVLSSLDIENRFGVQAWSGPAVLNVSGEGSFELMAKLVSRSGLVSNTNCVRERRVLNLEGQSSPNRTFIRFINTTDDPLPETRGTLYDKDGKVIGESNFVLFEALNARQSIWLPREEIATKAGGEWDDEAMLEVAETTGLKLLNLNLVNGETFFNFSCFETSASGGIYLQTTSTSRNISSTHIVNTSDTAQTFIGTLYDGSGTRLGDANQPLHTGTIAPKARLIISSSDLETVFKADAWSGPAVIEVKGIGDFELMTKLVSPSGLISNTNCVRRGEVHNIEAPATSAQTFVRFINTGDSEITGVKGTLYDRSGDVLGEPGTFIIESIPPKSAVWLNNNELSSIFNATWSTEASLKVESTDALRLLNLNFINQETFFNFSCYENSGS